MEILGTVHAEKVKTERTTMAQRVKKHRMVSNMQVYRNFFDYHQNF